MTVQVATDAAAIAACFPVMQELRPHLSLADFVAQVQRQQTQGYILAYVPIEAAPVAVTGFRLAESLAWGRFLYVEDLVTRDRDRGQGYGHQLLNWLAAYGQAQGCHQLHLDSGVQRFAAHRFYFREQCIIAGYHFTRSLT